MRKIESAKIRICIYFFTLSYASRFCIIANIYLSYAPNTQKQNNRKEYETILFASVIIIHMLIYV